MPKIYSGNCQIDGRLIMFLNLGNNLNRVDQTCVWGCKYLQTGMRVARTIYDDAGRILNKGCLESLFYKTIARIGFGVYLC